MLRTQRTGFHLDYNHLDEARKRILAFAIGESVRSSVDQGSYVSSTSGLVQCETPGY